MKVVFVLAFLISFSHAFAQQDPKNKYNGYVASPDSLIHGYLKIEGGSKERGNKISVFTRQGKPPLVFYTFEVNGYAYKKDTFEIFYNLPSQVDDYTAFDAAEARLYQKGKLTLYEIINVKQATVMMSVSGESGIVGRVVSKHFLVQDAKVKLWLVNARSFIPAMHQLLADSPPLLRAIDTKTLIYKDMKRIVTEYNKVFQQQ